MTAATVCFWMKSDDTQNQGTPFSYATADGDNIFTLTDYDGLVLNYCIVPKFSDSRKPCCNQPKIQTKRPKPKVFYQNGANGIANSEDPDQSPPVGAVRSGSALYASTYLSENRVITVLSSVDRKPGIAYTSNQCIDQRGIYAG